MERAGRLIAKLPKARHHLSLQDLTFAAWPAAVGKRLAGKAHPVALHNGRLLIEVDDELWRKDLYGLRGYILSNLRDMLESSAPREIEFRVSVQRRPPQREYSPAAFSLTAPVLPSGDEAEAITDPVLRRIYRNSRRKALA